MAWGIWNKIKKGLGKAVHWMGHHIGNIADVASDVADSIAHEFAPITHAVDDAAHGIQNAVTHNTHNSNS